MQTGHTQRWGGPQLCNLTNSRKNFVWTVYHLMAWRLLMFSCLVQTWFHTGSLGVKIFWNKPLANTCKFKYVKVTCLTGCKTKLRGNFHTHGVSISLLFVVIHHSCCCCHKCWIFFFLNWCFMVIVFKDIFLKSSFSSCVFFFLHPGQGKKES